MALDFEASSTDRIYGDLSTALTLPCTFACWVNPDATEVEELWLSIGDSSSPAYAALRPAAVDSGSVGLIWYDGTSSTYLKVSHSFTPIGSWTHVCGVVRALDDREFYVNGTSEVSSTTTLNGVTFNRVAIGVSADSTPYGDANAKIAEVGVWDSELTAGEIAAIGSGCSPLFVQPQNLSYYRRGIRGDDGQLMSNGTSSDTFGDPLNSEHPPITYPSAQMLYSVAAPAVTSRKYIVNGRIYEATGERKAIVNGRILEETVAADGWSIANIDLDDDVFDGQTGAIIAISGTVAASGKQVFIEQGGNTVEQTVTAEDASSVTITIGYGGLLTNGAATLLVNNPL